MNRIKATFDNLRKNRKKAVIAYITAGYPTLAATAGLMRSLESAGVDIIELGVPFSDPIADGPTIQKSSEIALKAGVTLASILKLVKDKRPKTSAPLVLMTYLNPVYSYGLKRFMDDAVMCGVDGVICPDLPPEEASLFRKYAAGKPLDIIFLASPTSTDERLRMIAKYSAGFIYYVSVTGVTGARGTLPDDLRPNIKRLRRITAKPVCVGFGISSPEQARAVARLADGVIVGSAIIDIIASHRGGMSMFKKVGEFAAGIAKAVHSAGQ